jgi:hypothetical protein
VFILEKSVDVYITDKFSPVELSGAEKKNKAIERIKNLLQCSRIFILECSERKK